jgi:hypothetical protein
MRISSVLLAAMFIAAPTAHAGEKTIMHCFAWTPVKEATAADWEAFYKASELLPKKINGLTKIWYGKLQSPLSQYTISKVEPDNLRKLRAGEPASAEMLRTPREYGMCMEFASADALKAYDTDPYHKTWTDAYAKVRVDGTTTVNIIGQ